MSYNKKCKGCELIKPLTEFSKASTYKGNQYYQSKCKNCLRLYSQKWRLENPGRTRYIQAKSKLKIGDADYQRISQIGYCEICGGRNKKTSLHIDHNHVTGVFRGALCPNCNHGLGKFFDDKDLLRNAILYLEKYE